MKSIKEKAEEYAFIKQGIDPVGIQFREFEQTNKMDLKQAQTMCSNR